jgi:dienelactone hydrolase
MLLLMIFAADAAAALARPFSKETGLDTVSIPLIAEGKLDPQDNTVTGYLFKPMGSGPFPAVVIIHGSGGLGWIAPTRPSWMLFKRYAACYVAQSYAALILDSFEPRGVDNVCGKSMKVSPLRRAWDALSAARWLGARLRFPDAAVHQ